MFDSHFFVRKAEAFLRFADAAGDPAIADHMRDKAARCHSQAELLRDDDQEHLPRAVRPAERATSA